jgi:hypothetical protein
MKRLLLLTCFAFTMLVGVAQNGSRIAYAEELVRTRQDAMRNNKSEIELDEALLNVRKKYSVLFGQAISPQKIDIFFKSEKEFGHYVQEEIKNRQLKKQMRLQDNP